MSNQQNPISLNLVIYQQRGRPALEIRAFTANKDIMKEILQAAITDKPITAFPIFRNRILATNNLISNGIIKLDKETGKYEFII